MNYLGIPVFAVVVIALSRTEITDARSFSIDFDNNTFVKDGEPFRYIAGSLHYGRVHPLYWQDRLSKMYMAGLDAVQTYVPWNLHEPVPGTYNFKDGADLEKFLTTANETGLLVILRAGPYICGEWDMGGLPSWLLRNQDIQLRSSDPAFLKYVDLWMGVLLPKVKPFLYANGGPIITVQVENEYGSYPACDHVYMRHLLQVFQSYLGTDVVYFSTDGPADNYLKCGTLQGIYSTIDFGAVDDPQALFDEQRKYEPKGPLVNSEYYTGWLDHWGEPHQTVLTSKVARGLDAILKLGANVNMYMFEGGTNFAYWNGANGDLTSYSPQPTSYDYDAPLSEAGDPNEKYYILRTIIGKYKKLTPGPIPVATKKYAYGKTLMSHTATLYDVLDKIAPYGPIRTTYPISMEDMQQDFGFMLYRTTLRSNYNTSPLTINGIHDRGYVFVDKIPVGILKRNTHVTLNITAQENSTLDILVENMGRLNYGCCINDSKGIIGNVTLAGFVLTSWQIFSLNLEKALDLKRNSVDVPSEGGTPSGPLQIPSFFAGTLPTGPQEGPQDTFLRMTGWSKGQAFINGFNLGRYWPTEGPQITLYVPAFVLNPTQNTLVLFETEHSPCNTSDPFAICSVEFIDRPIINSTIPPEDLQASQRKNSDSQTFWRENEESADADFGEHKLLKNERLSGNKIQDVDETWGRDVVPGKGSKNGFDLSSDSQEAFDENTIIVDSKKEWKDIGKEVVVSATEVMIFLGGLPAVLWNFFIV
ncbi:beta-galactosidase-like [Asterias rubens]|uniref:beta-galactosidase-like n=1 Tax=Asterias rubens TaxID=7604 RepID=UPI001455C3AD|nr:beta-galactosidase-like [Asterias rubens]